MSKIKISIAGGTGYTAGELMRILYQHPMAEIISVSSTSAAGKPFHSAHPDLEGLFEFPFASQPDLSADVLFLCLGHGVSTSFMDNLDLPKSLTIIDLSRDFRLTSTTNYKGREFIYGLPERNRSLIQGAQNIANPGCFATSIQLALLPIAKREQLISDVHVNAITGSTGAGGKLSSTTHFTWRNSNVSVYKAFKHQHIDEIVQSVHAYQPDFDHAIHFIPMRGNFSRGIFANVYTPTELDHDEAVAIYKDYYATHPFVQVSDTEISMKNVVNTNRCFLNVRVIEGQLYVQSTIDNLVKGASGQAVQNMNLMFGLEETTGLKLKPTML